MKKIILILLISVGLLFGNIGKITGIKGEAFVKRNSQELTATVGFILEKNDEIVTKDKSKVLLLFNDGTSITVGKLSVLRVNEYIQATATPSNNKANFGFGKGVFRTITGKIGKANPSGFKLETKSASLGIRGSDGSTLVKDNGDVSHTTNSGGFYMVNKRTGESIEIPKGMTAKFEIKTGVANVKITTKEDSEDVGDVSKNDDVKQEVTEEIKEETKEEEKQEKSQANEEKEQQQEEAKPEEKKEEQSIKEDETQEEKVTPTQTKEENQPLQEEQLVTQENEVLNDGGNENLQTPVNSESVETEDVVQTPQETNSIVSQPTAESPSFESFEGQTDEIEIEIPVASNPIIESQNIPVVNTDEIINETLNANPILSYEEISSVVENESVTIELKAFDSDNDKLTYAIVTAPSHGIASIDPSSGKIVYTPNTNYDGVESLSVTVSDGNGGTDTKIISFSVVNAYVSNITSVMPNGDLESLSVDLSTVTKEIIGSDTYNNTNVLEYGYILENGSKVATYLTGIATPSAVIEQYISNNQTANYSGNIASFVNGVATNGTINLNMNFGTKNFTGAVNVGENWKANINSGTLSSYGFNTTNITTASGSSVQNITGSLSGKYYGSNASSVGGTLQLNSGTNSVNGVFGGAKQ
jgi:hypothetical protein